jgi:hypothetical protein
MHPKCRSKNRTPGIYSAVGRRAVRLATYAMNLNLNVTLVLDKNEGKSLLEEVVELLDGADAPLEPLAGVPQVAHDETLLPPKKIWTRWNMFLYNVYSKKIKITLLFYKCLLLKFLT